MDGHPLSSKLEYIFSLLGSKSTSAVKQGKARLAALIEEEGDILLNRLNPVNIESRALTKWLSERIQKLFNEDSKFGGLYAVDLLLEVDYCDVTMRTMLFSRLLCDTAKSSTQPEVVELATQIWGKLLTNGCALLDDIVNAEIQDALERLDTVPLSSAKRFVSCLFLLEIADHAPGALAHRQEEVLALIWAPIKDPSASCRSAAARVLGKCLPLLTEVTEDAAHSTGELCETVMKNIIKGMQAKQPEAVHGSLTALVEAVPVMKRMDVKMRQFIAEVDSIIVSFLQKFATVPQIVRKALLDILPVMAKVDQDTFLQQVVPVLSANGYAGVPRGIPRRSAIIDVHRHWPHR